MTFLYRFGHGSVWAAGRVFSVFLSRVGGLFTLCRVHHANVVRWVHTQRANCCCAVVDDGSLGRQTCAGRTRGRRRNVHDRDSCRCCRIMALSFVIAVRVTSSSANATGAMRGSGGPGVTQQAHSYRPAVFGLPRAKHNHALFSRRPR